MNRGLNAETLRELSHDWENVEDLITQPIAFDINPQEMEMGTGEIPVINFTDEDEDAVKISLQDICVQLLDSLKL